MTFGATQALRDVSFSLAGGTAVGLVGANGAGKSTLIKILSGAIRPSSGAVLVDDHEVYLDSPRAARRAGIQTVHQNIDDAVVPGLSVADNLVLDDIGQRRWRTMLTERSVRRQADAIASAAGLDLPLGDPVERLSASDRQQITIARALSHGPRLLILDEPTSSLSSQEVDRLHELLARIIAADVTVLYVSHRLSEIQALCSEVIVLRDGALVRRFSRPYDNTAVVHAMLGDRPEGAGRDRRAAGTVSLQLREVALREDVAPFDLHVRRGEIVGVLGLLGSGKSSLLQQLYGLRRLRATSAELAGRPYAPRSPVDAVARGVAFVAEERGRQALVREWSVRQHVSLPALARYSSHGFLDRAREREETTSLIDRFSVRSPGPDAPMASLSGGNQQKVLVARWLASSPELLLLDDPFRGVDVGARVEIAHHLRQQPTLATLAASSDPEELLEVADRVVVLAEGRLVAEVETAATSAPELTNLMTTIPVP